MMAFAWAYCRVSTRKEEQEDSLDGQRARAATFAKDRALELRAFAEQASAKSITGRPVLSALLAEIESLRPRHRPKYLVVTALDRLFRNVIDGMYIGRVLREAKVAIFVIGTGEVALESFADRAQFVGASLGGDAENEGRSNRALDSWARRRRAGKPMSNKRPYGLYLENGVDVPAAASAEWVKKAFEWYANGDGTYLIAKRMSADAPPHTWLTGRIGADGLRISKTRRATLWESNRVAKLLRVVAYRDTLVTAELYDAVQERLASVPNFGNERKREYPLSGAMQCSGCHRHLHGRGSEKTSSRTLADGSVRIYARKPARFYSCSVCDYSVQANVLEEAFFSSIGRLAAQPALLKHWIVGPPLDRAETALLRKELKRLETLNDPARISDRRDRLFNLALAASINEVEFKTQMDIVDGEMYERGARCELLRKRIEAVAAYTRTIEKASSLLSRFRDLYECASYADKRELVGAMADALGGLDVSRVGLSWRALTTNVLEQPRRSAV